MERKFFAISFMGLVLLIISMIPLEYNNCYTRGNKWSDLGSDRRVSEALADLCDRMKGAARVGESVGKAIAENELPTRPGPTS
jgi:hypothetical protein